MAYNYDTVAGIYDRFSRLIFGSTQVRAQQYLLPFIPAGARVLIAGGGTGWVLEDVANLHPSGLTITYIDASAQMMKRAMQRNVAGNKVTFITGKAEELAASQYDVMITPFLFDNFTQEAAGALFSMLDRQLVSGGLWLYCDFQVTDRLSHRILLRVMYLFFGLCCGIAAKHMPDVPRYFRSQYDTAGSKLFMNGFIGSVVYRKTS